MSIYTKTPGVRNSFVYRRNGKMMKAIDVPSNIVDLLKTETSVDDENLPIQSPYKKCIFDGMETKLTRVANGQTLAICENHYHNTTLGQIVQQARLNEEVKREKVNQD